MKITTFAHFKEHIQGLPKSYQKSIAHSYKFGLKNRIKSDKDRFGLTVGGSMVVWFDARGEVISSEMW